jgi:hypothetical protein
MEWVNAQKQLQEASRLQVRDLKVWLYVYELINGVLLKTVSGK